MDTFPETFAFVQIHVDDAYATLWGNQRSVFYTDLMDLPTSYFDGTIWREGAHSYAQYEADYYTRRNTPTDVTIALQTTPITSNTATVNATVCIEPTGAGKTLHVYLVQVLDHWPANPSYSRNGFKQAAPTESITLAAGGCQVVSHTFTLDAGSLAQPSDIKLIVWAQEPQAYSSPTDRAEVYQAAQAGVTFMIDCNSNGIPDEQDIASGTSTDCNANVIPDECEFIDDPPLVDQSEYTELEYVYAQDFADSPYPAYSIKQWDDFTAPYEVALGEGHAWFRPTSWGGYAAIRFAVEIADVPGGAEAGGNVVLSTGGTGNAGVISWDFGGAALPAGTYWLSVQAMGGFESYGLVYWHRTNIGEPNGSTHYYHNPGGGWGHGTTPQPITNWPHAAGDLVFTQHIIRQADCNTNGILDECDIAAGTSQDANGNGIPDECEQPQVCPGDANCDGTISWRDIDFFVAAVNDNVAAWEALFAPGTPGCPFGNNDVNADGTVSWRDIDPLVAVMNTTCPQGPGDPGVKGPRVHVIERNAAGIYPPAASIGGHVAADRSLREGVCVR